MVVSRPQHNPPNVRVPPAPSHRPKPYRSARRVRCKHVWRLIEDGNCKFCFLPQDPLTSFCVSCTSPEKQRPKSRRQSRCAVRSRQMVAQTVSPPPAVLEELDYEGPEWSIIEDQELLKAVGEEERKGHSIEKGMGGLHYNWEFIAMAVNQISRFYRSPRQCSIRYQTVLKPRENGQWAVINPITKKTAKVPVTKTEIDHFREGRFTVFQQYSHDAGKLRESALLGRLRLIESLADDHYNLSTAKQLNQYLPSELGSPLPPELGSRLPPEHEKRLAALKVPVGLSPNEILAKLEEKRIAKETAKKELDKQDEANNDQRPSSPPPPVIRVSVRAPAVAAGPDIVQSKFPIVVAVPQLKGVSGIPSSEN